MNKYSIKDISIINKSKKKIVGIKLENKENKFILYSYENELPSENNNFSPISFKEKITISTKKKMNDLNISIKNEEDSYHLLMNDKKVFYSKDNKPILTNDEYRLIQNNGELYMNIEEEESIINHTFKDADETNGVFQNIKKEEPSLITNLLTKNNTIDKKNKVKKEIMVGKKDNSLVSKILSKTIHIDDLLSTSSPEPEPEPAPAPEPEQEPAPEPEPEPVPAPAPEPVQEPAPAPEPAPEPVQEPEPAPAPEPEPEPEPAPEPEPEPAPEPAPAPEPVQEPAQAPEPSSETIKLETNSVEGLQLNNDILKNILNSGNKDQNIMTNIKKILKDKDLNLTNILQDFNSFYLDETKNIEKQSNKKMINVSFLDKKYLVQYHPLVSSNINIYNIQKIRVLKENIIVNHTTSFLLENKNSSYYIEFKKNTYLINKIDNKVLLTKLQNKKTIILSNNQFFKILDNTYFITNNCTLLLSIENKKINSSGKIVQYFEPYLA